MEIELGSEIFIVNSDLFTTKKGLVVEVTKHSVTLVRDDGAAGIYNFDNVQGLILTPGKGAREE